MVYVNARVCDWYTAVLPCVVGSGSFELKIHSVEGSIDRKDTQETFIHPSLLNPIALSESLIIFIH